MRPESEVRNRLRAGGKRIRTPGPPNGAPADFAAEGEQAGCRPWAPHCGGRGLDSRDGSARLLASPGGNLEPATLDLA
jgi:hypothetical protein